MKEQKTYDTKKVQCICTKYYSATLSHFSILRYPLRTLRPSDGSLLGCSFPGPRFKKTMGALLKREAETAPRGPGTRLLLCAEPLMRPIQRTAPAQVGKTEEPGLILGQLA